MELQNCTPWQSSACHPKNHKLSLNKYKYSSSVTEYCPSIVSNSRLRKILPGKMQKKFRPSYWPVFVFLVSESDLSVSQLCPRERVVLLYFSASRLFTFLPSEQDQPSVTRLLNKLKDQLLRRTVWVFHLQQGGEQRGKTIKGNQQGPVDMEGRRVGVHWEDQEKKNSNQ